MKYLMQIVFVVIVILNSSFSCEEELDIQVCESVELITSTSTQEEDELLISDLYEDIMSLVESYSCENAVDWTFTPIGDKPCGGPSAYMAYPKALNNSDFLDQVKCYTELTRKFNNKYGLSSTCEVTPQPSSVTCENGNPVLVY